MANDASRSSVDRHHRFKLPSADAEALAAFQKLWTEKFGEPLPEAALEPLATRVLQIVYLQNFGTAPGCIPKSIVREDETATDSK